VKLTLPGTQLGLRTIVVRSTRLDGELVLRQSNRRVDARPDRLERAVRIRRDGLDFETVPRSIREVEYSRNVGLPDRYRARGIPSYFRARGARIRLALSLRVARSTIDLDPPGIFYYPLGASRSRTGFLFSLCAPFEMNEDRSQLVDLGTSDWNAWLVDQCAQLAADLLASDVFADVGAAGYVAFDTRRADTATVPALVEAVDNRLRSQACWPSRATTARTKRPVFQAATSLTMPSTPALAEVVENCLPAAKVCHPALLDHPQAQQLAAHYGAARLTINSLVRLWCAGSVTHGLATKPRQGEANLHYVEYPAALRDLALQRRLATALDAVRKELSDQHSRDLRRSAPVLSAEMTLAPLGQLWHVDATFAEAIPASQRLHPELAEYSVIRSLARSFSASRWVIETSERLRDGQGSEQERAALARLLRDGPPISDKAWAAARRAPVLQDQRGDWTAPADLVSRRTPNAGLLAAALHYPRAEDERNARLAKLRVRTTLEPGDLLALARLVEAGAEPPAILARAIDRLPKLLTPATVRRLRDIAFVETTTGTLASPSGVYERTDRLAAALDEDAPFAACLPPKVLKQLKCPTLPPVDDIVAALRQRRERRESLPRPELAYRVLVEAARAERRSPGSFRNEPILWTGANWEAPADCLTGNDNASLFRDAVTVLPGQHADLYRVLGVPSKPEPTHWRRLFEWAGHRYGHGRPVPWRVAQRLTRAYQRLDALPGGLPSTTACLLDENRVLHTLEQAGQGRLLFDDDPALAASVRSASSSVAFVHAGELGTYRFLREAGVKSLTAVARLERTSSGNLVEPSPLIRLSPALARLHRPDFASALRALVSTLRGHDLAGPPARIADALAMIDHIVLIDGITRHYCVHSAAVDVPVEYDLEPRRILLAATRSPHEFWEQLSAAIAALVEPTDTSVQALRDPVYVLLRCTTVEQLRRALARRKVAWKPDSSIRTDDDEQDDESVMDIDPTSLLAEVIGRAATEDPPRPPLPTEAAIGPVASAPRPQPGQLPDLNDVQAKAVSHPPHLRPRPSASGFRGAPSSWIPRDDYEQDEDRELGRRGEQLVLRHLQEHLRADGRSPDLAVWVADSQPLADHDIRTVDANGQTLWVEVKATRGRHGRFRWPRAEFQLALRVRDRYLLYRVYEADTLSLTLLEICDPISRFQTGDLALDLDSLAGDLGALPSD